LEAVIFKALEKEKTQRYQTAAEMRQALSAARERLFACARKRRPRWR